MEKKRLFFDMDNVLVDFASGIARLDEATKQEYEGRLDEVPGIFSLMDPMPGAIDAVHRLAEKYDYFDSKKTTPAVLGRTMNNIKFNFKHRSLNGLSEYWLIEK